MAGENNGPNPMNKWDDLGGNTPIFGNILMTTVSNISCSLSPSHLPPESFHLFGRLAGRCLPIGISSNKNQQVATRNELITHQFVFQNIENRIPSICV